MQAFPVRHRRSDASTRVDTGLPCWAQVAAPYMTYDGTSMACPYAAAGVLQAVFRCILTRATARTWPQLLKHHSLRAPDQL
jgi:hypothetical protein